MRGSGNAAIEWLDREADERAFLGISGLLFLASAAGTIYWCESMSGGMAMPGGWTMSMAWMRMPGQSWFDAGGAFMGMWVLMMVAMMLPSLVPMLAIYRRSQRARSESQLGGLTVLVGAGYFFVWSLLGAAVYPTGVILANVEMQRSGLARSVPVAIGVVLLLAGFLQLTAWKAAALARCQSAPGCDPPLSSHARTAWQHGLRLGVHCVLCCSGFMAILLVTGVMSLSAMAIVAAAITVERFAPRPERAARITGVVAIAAGVLAIARALVAA